MTDPIKPAPLPQRTRPTTAEEHLARVYPLSGVIALAVNAQNEFPAVVLDALLHTYLVAAQAFGLAAEAAQVLVQTGGQTLLAHAQADDVLRAEAAAPPPIVH